ncbi:UNVERIFIED_CONTAM: hypothetical protein FKN15_070154 [Acipenser sinensis]
MGDILKESPESGLDFIQGEKELVSVKFGEMLQDNALNLEDFFRHSRYPSLDQMLSRDKGPDCPILQWDLGQDGFLPLHQEDWAQGGSNRKAGLQPQALETAVSSETQSAELSSGQELLYCDQMHDQQDCGENVLQGLAHCEPGLDQNLLSQEKVHGNVDFNQNLSLDKLHDEQGLCLDAVHGKTVLDQRLSQNILLESTVLDQNSVLDIMREKEVLDPDLSQDVVHCDQPILDQYLLDVSEQESSPSLLQTNARSLECVSALPGQLLAEGALTAGGSLAVGEEAVELSPLRAVFDVLDQDQDGFVRMEEFVQFATVYGAEQVKDLTRFLDPGGLGVLSFEDFYRGITAISNEGSDSQLYEMGFSPGAEAVGCPEEYDDYAAYERSENYSAVKSAIPLFHYLQKRKRPRKSICWQI